MCCVTSCCFLYGISFFQNVKKLRLCHEKSGKTNTVLSAKNALCCSNITYSTAGRNFGRILGENGRYAHCSVVSFACCRKTPVVIVYTFYSKSSCSNMNHLKSFLNLVQVALMRSISAFPKGVFLHRWTERILLWAPLFRAGERGQTSSVLQPSPPPFVTFYPGTTTEGHWSFHWHLCSAEEEPRLYSCPVGQEEEEEEKGCWDWSSPLVRRSDAAGGGRAEKKGL